MSDFIPDIYSNLKYNVYDFDGSLIKSDCTLQATISSGLPLSKAEVKKYFGIDESHPEYEKCRRPHCYQRFVFDKCVIPNSRKFRIEVVEESEE